MTCHLGEGVVICTPTVTSAKIVRRTCPTENNKRTRQLAEFQEWYGWEITCLSCGESWQDGERAERPFERGWRERAIEMASNRVAYLREKGLLP